MRNAALALICLSCLAVPAAAEPMTSIVVTHRTPTATVRFSRADFVSPHARRMLDLRIRDAIESVCGSYAMIESFQVPGMDACWHSAEAQAAHQLPLAMAQAQPSITLAAR
jgi:UrcA family protein